MITSTPELRVCERARLARDARFDGRFFIAVTSTGIYCRPICPARSPRAAHVRYYASAAEAADAGFRPCLRCRPEAAPGTPAWRGSSALVGRAVRLIGEGACADGGGIDALAARLGIGPRHLHRLFVQHVGAPPVAVVQTWRLGFAKRLLDETTLPVTQVALVSGFGSIRRFNDAFRAAYQRPPSQVRRRSAAASAAPRSSPRRPGDRGEELRPYELTLAYRPPYDWKALLTFLAARATPGIEAVEGGAYRRTIVHRGAIGSIVVRPLPTHGLGVTIAFPDPAALPHIVARVRAMFDLAADPSAIASAFERDPLLGRLVRAHRGLRIPAAWDPFELAVRAIVGQQVTVRGATTLMGRLAKRLGASVGDGAWSFPAPELIAEASVADLGVTAARAHAIRTLARETAEGRLFVAGRDSADVVRALVALPGIGDWTAQYIAMRGLGDPDAFPTGDLGLRIAASNGDRITARALSQLAERWRPWRAYAAMHLWQSLADRAVASTTHRLKPVGSD
jgi:AraC family transcriptional regulator, regulatory protein of adaptative response / DNA-3-methyladenine glycosylase II